MAWRNTIVRVRYLHKTEYFFTKSIKYIPRMPGLLSPTTP